MPPGCRFCFFTLRKPPKQLILRYFLDGRFFKNLFKNLDIRRLNIKIWPSKMIHIDNIYKNFGPLRALGGVSFEVAKGEVVGLLGPNGAGKTTTLRIITGYLKPDSGAVTINGLSVADADLRTRKMTGYLPENAPLYYDMEVVEFLTYIARLRSLCATDIQARIDEMIDVCRLSEVVGRSVGKLSKGYRQRVGLAAAMMHKPEVLILDEPTSGLDPNQIVEIRNLIREIGHERTVILSTHIMQEVEATCSRAFIISSGRLVGQGTIEELIKMGKTSLDHTVGIKGARAQIETKLSGLAGFEFLEWISSKSGVERFVVKSTFGDDRSDEIFRWAVDSGLVLTELSSVGASLEEVFRELTQN